MLRFTPRARRRLRHAGRVRLTVAVTISAAGATTRARRTIALRGRAAAAYVWDDNVN